MNSQIFCVGVCHVTRSLLERQIRNGKRINFRIIGLLALDSDITPELVQNAVGSVRLRGRVKGNALTVAALQTKQRR